MESWTVLRLLNWTTDYLRGKGVESANLEARILLAHVLGWKPIDLYTRSEEEPREVMREVQGTDHAPSCRLPDCLSHRQAGVL